MRGSGKADGGGDRPRRSAVRSATGRWSFVARLLVPLGLLLVRLGAVLEFLFHLFAPVLRGVRIAVAASAALAPTLSASQTNVAFA